jgi:hypothetical protein
MSSGKHKNYELLNLLGYGLSKFNKQFMKQFGFSTKTAFYNSLVKKGIASTSSTIKNRQDLFDPFFDNGRKGWWQKGEAYIHRKIFIDSLFGDLDAKSFAEVVKLYIGGKFESPDNEEVKPIIKSKFKQLQLTGNEAESFFIHNFQKIIPFKSGILEDARFLGDGYDFQVEVLSKYYLAEVKGIREEKGSIRLTKNEFSKANEYQNDYALVVISNLQELPKITTIFNPISEIDFKKNIISQQQIFFNTKHIQW